MEEIGKLLKERRIKMKISLKDVHKAIKIQEKYLEAIENGDSSVFLAEVYYRGFLKSYAKYLGFNPEEIMEQFKLSKHYPDKECDEEDKDFGQEISVYKNKINTRILIVIVVAVILLGVFLYLNRKISKISSPNETPQTETINEQPQKDGTKTVINKQEEKEPPLITIKQKLTIEALGNVWLRVTADGKDVYEGTLMKGSKNYWEADEAFKLRIGYVNGLKVFFNGNEVDICSGASEGANTIILKKE